MGNNEDIEATFDTFNPRGYLAQYYSTIDFENDQLLRFFAICYEDISPHAFLLEFGGGPTLYSLITAAAKVSTIHFSDKLQTNLKEVLLWKRGDKDAFNWEPFIKRALEIEGNGCVTQEDIKRRAALIRSKPASFCYCDAFRNPPLWGDHRNTYDILQVNFVPESITSSLIKWELAFRNILTLLKPRGTLILSALKNATYYHLEDRKFPAVDIDEVRLIQILLTFGFDSSNISMQMIRANYPYRGYEGMVFIRAQR